MEKYLSASDFHIQLVNYKKVYPYVKISIPMDFSFEDLADIVKRYTKFAGDYACDFYFPYYETHLSSKFRRDEFDQVKMSEYLSVRPNTICSYGLMKIEISSRYRRKLTKAVPVAYEAVGTFPAEAEMKGGFFCKFKKLTPEAVVEELKENYYKIVDANSSPSNVKLTKADLGNFNAELRGHFGKKYRISDETYEYENEVGPNKLARI